ncbi:MAG: DUF1800 domain-containing protein [Phycisphaerales bacterium]|nr:DUF1800 domain-containing protein [Phycisphaerales bacterium]
MRSSEAASGVETASARSEGVRGPAGVSRREVISGLRALRGVRRSLAGFAAAAGGVAGVLGAARPARAGESSADVDPSSLLVKLVGRISFGVNDYELNLANTLGYQGYLDYHLNPSAITEDPALVTKLSALATLNLTGQQLYDSTVVPNSGQIVTDLYEATIQRAIFSRRQLYEKMVEFWSDHFSIDITLENETYLKTLDDRLVIRALAMTSFPQLLNASARSPAMLYYLNNDLSRFNSINENYAREVLELHSMGVDSGYTQADVIAVARCLTGWTWYTGSYNDTSVGGTGTTLRGTFRYLASNHDPNSKTLSPVFNLSGSTPVTIPARSQAQGQQDFIDVLNIISAHPATALFIATKLCRRFLGEDVPQQTINAVRDTYLNPANPQGIGDITAMLRVILAPNRVADATPRLKRPFHLFASACRALNLAVSNTTGYRTRLNQAGHLPFNWSPPDGYPDTTQYWSGNVLARWNFCASSPTAGISGVTFDSTTFFAGTTTNDQIVDRIDQKLFQGNMAPAEKARVRAYLPATTLASSTQRNEAVGLALGSPGFQTY